MLKAASHDKPQEITLALVRRTSSSKHNTEMVFNASSADADLRRLKEEIKREKEKIQRLEEEENRKKELRLAREMEERARRQRDRRM